MGIKKKQYSMRTAQYGASLLPFIKVFEKGARGKNFFQKVFPPHFHISSVQFRASSAMASFSQVMTSAGSAPSMYADSICQRR